MSFNRLRYDNCAYSQELNESVGTLSYVLDPSKYENCNKCRMELGIIGGTNVSHIKGNLVDLETDLRGTTRMASKCPTKKYQNPCPKGEMTTCQPDKIVIRGNGCNQPRVLDTSMQHLPSCQMIRYKPIPLEPSMPPVLCPQQEASNANNVANNANTRENFGYNYTASNSFDQYASAL
jgi:hypothetical protein